ncbi:MAG: hypothetical protein A3D92_16955 [Bacteroidetes bacterium RIFCSPHIGHO2_02_FULL_44_7]|nr:MAG: hypothetical protein A3D92_16955 [Bacteroidetes bacterium RIFCSPHIGHO2_02_FULL_44_7]
MIEALALPKAELRLKRKKNVVYVWCILRKKELVCTPEEWVRQHVIHYLINEANISIGRIASEYPLEYNGLKKRADVVVFDSESKPFLIVECKATSVPVSTKTLDQIAQYNSQLQVPWLWLTNGLRHVHCRIDSVEASLVFGEGIPVLHH